MSDHGTTGAVFTLALLKRTALGEIRIETQVGQVSAIFDQNGTRWKSFWKKASNCWVASCIPESGVCEYRIRVSVGPVRPVLDGHRI
jgi:hypothetical protein